MTKNLTIALDSSLVDKIRVLAAKRGTSISGFLRGEIERLVGEDEAYESARRRALRRLKKGARLGGGELPAREDLHDRARLR